MTAKERVVLLYNDKVWHREGGREDAEIVGVFYMFQSPRGEHELRLQLATGETVDAAVSLHAFQGVIGKRLMALGHNAFQCSTCGTFCKDSVALSRHVCGKAKQSVTPDSEPIIGPPGFNISLGYKDGRIAEVNINGETFFPARDLQKDDQ